MIRDDAILEIRNRLGEEEEDFWSDADELIPFLNKGVTRFASEARWPWYLTEVSDTLAGGESDYELPDGLLFPKGFGVLLTANGQLRPYQPTRVPAAKGQELRQTFYVNATYPQWYYLVTVQEDGDADVQNYIQVVRFIPTPISDMDLNFLYYRSPFKPDAGSAELDVPDDYIDGPIAYATYLAWKKELQGSNKAQESLEEYAYVVSSAKRDVRKDSDDATRGWGNEEPQFLHGVNDDPIALRLPELFGP